ncbi:MAG: GNAT family N-acetyltransferase [Pseudorhodobacter sp.]
MTAADMAALHALCFTMPRPWSQAEFSALLADPTTFTLYEKAALLLGRVILDEAELLTLAVAPQARGQGLGLHLLLGFETSARARGARCAFLEVAANNTTALGLYLGHGWSQAGLRQHYYTNPEGQSVDALILTRNL